MLRAAGPAAGYRASQGGQGAARRPLKLHQHHLDTLAVPAVQGVFAEPLANQGCPMRGEESRRPPSPWDPTCASP